MVEEQDQTLSNNIANNTDIDLGHVWQESITHPTPELVNLT